MHHPMRFAIAVIFLSGTGVAGEVDPRDTGQPAPPIELQQLLQAPPGTTGTLESLRGKVIVLEFWATWCSSCVKDIPLFNALADQLKDQPVQFISITDEDEKTIVPFLATTPIRGWVGLNTSGSMFRSYAIDDGRPLTVVIGPDGIVNARIRPWAQPFPITARNLIDLAQGKASGIVNSRFIFAGDVRDSQGNPLAGAEVQAINPLAENSWMELARTQSDANGNFKIDREYPLSYFSGRPIRLIARRDGLNDAVIDDLRPMSSQQMRSLHLTLSPK